MRDFGNAMLRYCPQLKQNVIIEVRRDPDNNAKCLECLNKRDCGYDKLGCRNLLIEKTPLAAEGKSS